MVGQFLMALNTGVPLTTTMVANRNNVERGSIVHTPCPPVNPDTVNVYTERLNHIPRHTTEPQIENATQILKMEAGVGIEPA